MKKGSIKYYVWIVLPVVAAIIIVTRWDVWFGNPIEPSFNTPSTPSRIMLTMGNEPHSRIITWLCDTTVQEAYVEYYYVDSLSEPQILHTKAESEKYISQGGCSVFYRASIENLCTGQYLYRMCHPSSSSPWHSFHINSTDDNSSRFIFIGDIQDTINGITNGIIENIAQRHNNVDYYLLGGDFIHRPHDCYWEEGFRGIAPIATTQTLLAVSGNHEHLKGISSSCERRFPLHFAYFLPEYDKHNYCFHTLRHENIELFLFDSHCDIIKLIKQRQALEKALQESSAQWKVVVLHHPPHSIRSKWNNIHLQWMLTHLFSQHHVDLVLSGHEHGYARLQPSEQLPIYTISHCSPKQYHHRNRSAAIRYDSGHRYYQVIDINKNTLQLDVYTTDGQLIDMVKIIQENGEHIVQ